jgi:hypothetical protein
MAGQMQPSSPKDAPDPSNAYERSHPEREGGLDRKFPDTKAPYNMHRSVQHRQDPKRQLNADEVVNRRGGPPEIQPNEPNHSMKDEEPLGADQRPLDIDDPQRQRQPRTGGKGGTPDAGESTKNG